VPQGNRGVEHRIVAPATTANPAWIVPPLANFGNGPAQRLPRHRLNDNYKDHFFACDFLERGQRHLVAGGETEEAASRSKPEPFVKGWCRPTTSSGRTGRSTGQTGSAGDTAVARIFRVTDEAMKTRKRRSEETPAEGFERRKSTESGELLDSRIVGARSAVQLARAAGRRDEAFAGVEGLRTNSRLHAVWGLGRSPQLFKRKISHFAPRATRMWKEGAVEQIGRAAHRGWSELTRVRRRSALLMKRREGRRRPRVRRRSVQVRPTGVGNCCSTV
jgi:quinoprotein glucose dehydrogenase